ncbi:type II toxin-antitoxin system HigB family toxin [Rhizobium sp. SG2393]|uniref:type II toxin-antitoxin system HigB family toxin n=1 Tax=Rhizobium sp. SG2393 TaxID=3276279 RepID=UPI003671628A
MQIVAKATLRRFWTKHSQSEMPLRTWYATVSAAEWASPADLKGVFGKTVDFVGDDRVIFDIAGNKYRLVVHVSYPFKRVLVKFIGTHGEHDKINAETV